MLDGWYCRSLANQKTTSTKTNQEHLESDEEAHTKQSTMPGTTAAASAAGATTAASSSTSTGTANENIDYKERYRNLKRKLKFLIYVSNNRCGCIDIFIQFSYFCTGRKTNIFKTCYTLIKDVY